jgi:flagellar basal body-associated protein FliL
MALAALVCGILGLSGLLYSVFRFLYLSSISDHPLFQMFILKIAGGDLLFILIVSILLLILALCFGIAERKKKSGIAGIVLSLVGLLPVLCITLTICVNNNFESRETLDPTAEYIGTRPQYSTFTLIGQVNTRTRDLDHTVVVDMLIEYDLNNSAAQNELAGNVNQLRDFTRNYFAGKYYNELEDQQILKQEIREILNTRYLDTAKVRNILFNKLDVMEL